MGGRSRRAGTCDRRHRSWVRLCKTHTRPLSIRCVKNVIRLQSAVQSLARFAYDHNFGLYDLETDIGESKDVAAEHPEVVARLSALADGIRGELGDALTGVEPTARRPPGRIETPRVETP